MIVVVNHTLAFSLELALLAAFAFCGHQVIEHAVGRWIVPIVLVILVTELWGRFAAPNSRTQLVMPGILIFKAAMLSVGAAAIFGLGKPVWVIAFGVLVLNRIGQHDRLAGSNGHPRRRRFHFI